MFKNKRARSIAFKALTALRINCEGATLALVAGKA